MEETSIGEYLSDKKENFKHWWKYSSLYAKLGAFFLIALVSAFLFMMPLFTIGVLILVFILFSFVSFLGSL